MKTTHDPEAVIPAQAGIQKKVRPLRALYRLAKTAVVLFAFTAACTNAVESLGVLIGCAAPFIEGTLETEPAPGEILTVDEFVRGYKGATSVIWNNTRINLETLVPTDLGAQFNLDPPDPSASELFYFNLSEFPPAQLAVDPPGLFNLAVFIPGEHSRLILWWLTGRDRDAHIRTALGCDGTENDTGRHQQVAVSVNAGLSIKDEDGNSLPPAIFFFDLYCDVDEEDRPKVTVIDYQTIEDGQLVWKDLKPDSVIPPHSPIGINFDRAMERMTGIITRTDPDSNCSDLPLDRDENGNVVDPKTAECGVSITGQEDHFIVLAGGAMEDAGKGWPVGASLELTVPSPGSLFAMESFQSLRSLLPQKLNVAINGWGPDPQIVDNQPRNLKAADVKIVSIGEQSHFPPDGSTTVIDPTPGLPKWEDLTPTSVESSLTLFPEDEIFGTVGGSGSTLLTFPGPKLQVLRAGEHMDYVRFNWQPPYIYRSLSDIEGPLLQDAGEISLSFVDLLAGSLADDSYPARFASAFLGLFPRGIQGSNQLVKQQQWLEISGGEYGFHNRDVSRGDISLVGIRNSFSTLQLSGEEPDIPRCSECGDIAIVLHTAANFGDVYQGLLGGPPPSDVAGRYNFDFLGAFLELDIGSCLSGTAPIRLFYSGEVTPPEFNADASSRTDPLTTVLSDRAVKAKFCESMIKLVGLFPPLLTSGSIISISGVDATVREFSLTLARSRIGHPIPRQVSDLTLDIFPGCFSLVAESEAGRISLSGGECATDDGPLFWSNPTAGTEFTVQLTIAPITLEANGDGSLHAIKIVPDMQGQFSVTAPFGASGKVQSRVENHILGEILRDMSLALFHDLLALPLGEKDHIVSTALVGNDYWIIFKHDSDP